MVGALRLPGAGVTTNMVGGYGYRAVDRLLLGGEGAGVFGRGARGGFGLFTVGYALWSRPKWQVYPFWGFGGGSFTVGDRSPGGGFLLGVGLGADVMATREPNGYTVGARAGYLFRFDDDPNTFYLGLSFGRSRRR